MLKAKYVCGYRTFQLTDEEAYRVEGLRRSAVNMFCHYDIVQIAEECGFYQRLNAWYKENCKNFDVCYWDDYAPYMYDKDKKTFTFNGKEFKYEEV